MSIVQLLKSFFGFLDGLMDYLSGERLRKLGRLEAEQEQAAVAQKNEAIAQEIDSRPTPRDKSVILNGMLKPKD